MDTDESNSTISMENTGENERTLHSGSGRIYLRRQDPYGFWHVSFESGSVPERLSSVYTTLDMAQAAITNYIESNRERQRQIKIKAERERVRNAKAIYEEKHPVQSE